MTERIKKLDVIGLVGEWIPSCLKKTEILKCDGLAIDFIKVSLQIKISFLTLEFSDDQGLVSFFCSHLIYIYIYYIERIACYCVFNHM